ncbi:hypothetical protein GGS21DRAFT_486416 [Xylaria nigripes]|nr:hypothetical protein GGS21DRAFT_486416 [Xylaria nigripes]
MSLLRAFPALIGLTAVLATMAILASNVVFAYGLWSFTSPIRRVAVVASVAEAITLALILAKFCKNCLGMNAWFALDLIASVMASVVSTILLILIGKARDLPTNVLTIPITNAVIGSSVALAFAFIGQLFFAVVYFILRRKPDSEKGLSLCTSEDGQRRSPFPTRVKTVPYDRTKPAVSQFKLEEWSPSEYSSRPGTSGGRSATETVTSFSGSLSKARLLSQSSRSGWRQGSLDSTNYLERSSVVEDGFDSWDTSFVDPHNRQLLLEICSPTRSRFLEPIPASPANSRSPSPGCPLDIEPPKQGPRDRCYSPVPQTQQERTLKSSDSELHIHPLFRSDSPNPPPTATPGTVVVAAPNAGQFITGMSVNQMRCGSSPLSRTGSYESSRKTPSPDRDR